MSVWPGRRSAHPATAANATAVYPADSKDARKSCEKPAVATSRGGPAGKSMRPASEPTRHGAELPGSRSNAASVMPSRPRRRITQSCQRPKSHCASPRFGQRYIPPGSQPAGCAADRAEAGSAGASSDGAVPKVPDATIQLRKAPERIVQAGRARWESDDQLLHASVKQALALLQRPLADRNSSQLKSAGPAPSTPVAAFSGTPRRFFTCGDSNLQVAA